MPKDGNEGSDFSVDEAVEDPSPPGSSSLTRKSSGSHNKPPKGEIPEEGKMSGKESLNSKWNWIKERRDEIVLGAIVVILFALALIFTPFGLSLEKIIAIEVIALAVIFFIKNPLGLGTVSALLISILVIVIAVAVAFGDPVTKFINRVMNPVVKLNDVPGASARNDLASLKILARQFSIKGTADLDRLYNEGKIDGNQYLVFTQLFKNDQTLATELSYIASAQDENNISFGTAVKDIDVRVTKVDKNVEKVAKAVNQVAGETVIATSPTVSLTISSSDSSPNAVGVYNTAVTNILSENLYVILYGDWDGAKIVKLSPKDSLKAGFGFGDGKSILSGIHLNLLTLYNNGKTYTETEAFGNKEGVKGLIFYWDGKTYRPNKTELATYYWSQGLTPITGKTHYNKAFTIVDDNGAFWDGYKVTERMGGSNVAVAVDTFQAGRIPTRTMRQ